MVHLPLRSYTAAVTPVVGSFSVLLPSTLTRINTFGLRVIWVVALKLLPVPVFALRDFVGVREVSEPALMDDGLRELAMGPKEPALDSRFSPPPPPPPTPNCERDSLRPFGLVPLPSPRAVMSTDVLRMP